MKKQKLSNKKTEKLFIIGAGGHGSVVADIALKTKKYASIAFLDDVPRQNALAPVVDRPVNFGDYTNDAVFFVAIGDAALRQKFWRMLAARNAPIATLVHPAAILGADVQLGAGTVVMAGAVINPGARIGNGVIINTCSSVDHDCHIGDFCHVSVGAHLSGGVILEAGTFVGAGATVIQKIHVHERCIVGAGTVVIHHINEPGTYIGVPARRLTRGGTGGEHTEWLF